MLMRSFEITAHLHYTAARSFKVRPTSSFPQSAKRAHIRRRLAPFSTTPRIMTSIQRTALFEAIQKHDPGSIAVVHSKTGETYRYGLVLRDVAAAKQKILQATGHTEKGIEGERVAFLVENGYDYVVTLLAVLASNAIAVPLAPSFPSSELRYVLNHSSAAALLYTDQYTDKAKDVLSDGLDKMPKEMLVERLAAHGEESGRHDVELSSQVEQAKGGMMLYTSGTTARPKGVLLSQSVLAAQARSLLEAWEYSPKDRLLHVLPLHHIHGTVNALLTPLLSGSSIEFTFPFNPDQIWKRFGAPFLSGDKAEHEKVPITFFTVVPTIWARLLQTHAKLPKDLQQASNEAVQRRNLRLNISGSAALPTPTKKAWTDLSHGNILLERYGMTEVGMALSCGLADEDRIDGSVGWPLPSVEARLVDPDTNAVIAVGEEVTKDGKERSGEIQLRGPTIFQGYWQNQEATDKEFTEGWFKTGDMAIRKKVQDAGEGKSGAWARGPAYFIQGRTSADIIKTGGEKVSALEVERELLSLPQVQECAVVGLPSETWGQKGAAIIVLTEEGKKAGKGGKAWSALDMRRVLKEKLVAYKIPQDMKVVEELPRNAMGKINKKDLVKQVFGNQDQIRRRSIEVQEEREAAKRQGNS